MRGWKRRNLVFTVLILIISLSAVPAALGAAIGVNKAALSYQNVLRNGYAQDTIIISTDMEDDVFIETNVMGDIKDWIRFEPEEVILYNGSPAALTVIVEPPETVANGEYEGEITLLTSPIINTRSGDFGSAIRTSFKIKVDVEITGDEIVACTAGGFNIEDAEINFPLEFSASVHNDGNVRISPDFVIDIWDQEQRELLTTIPLTYGSNILPTTTQKVVEYIEDVNLDTGQYWADISSPLCGNTGLITFDILERGEIVDTGEIQSVKNELWVKVGDIVPIEVVFKNTGERVESAKLKGTIKLADQIIKVIDTDPVNVLSGDTVTLETYVNPKMAGQYIINVRVLYNNKLSFWKSSLFNALPSEEFDRLMRQQAIKAWLQIGIVVVVIIILLILIQIKKKKKKKKIRLKI